MPDIIITSQFILQASVAAAGTLAIAYPANETQASMSARNFDTINLLSAGGRTYTGMTASYGSGSITLTNGSGYALPAGTYYVEFANPVEADDATDGRPLARYGTDASGNTVLLGAGDVKITALIDPATPVLLLGGDHAYLQWYGSNGADGMAQMYADRGLRPYLAINTGNANTYLDYPTDYMSWDAINAVSNRVDIIAHGHRHPQEWDQVNTGITVRYTGAAASATVAITTTTISATTTGAVDDFSYTLTDAAYNTLGELVAAIDALANWTCSMAEELDGTEASNNLLVRASADAKTADLNLCAGGGILIVNEATTYKRLTVGFSGTAFSIYGDGVRVLYQVTAGNTLAQIVTAINAITGIKAYLCDDTPARSVNYCSGSEDATCLANSAWSSNRHVTEDGLYVMAGLTHWQIVDKQFKKCVTTAAANGLTLRHFAQSGGNFYPKETAGHSSFIQHRGNRKSGSSIAPNAFMKGGDFIHHNGASQAYYPTNSTARLNALLQALVDSRGYCVNLLCHNLQADGTSGYYLTRAPGFTVYDQVESDWVAFLDAVKAQVDAGNLHVMSQNDYMRAVGMNPTHAGNLLFNPRLRNSGESLVVAASNPGTIIPGWRLGASSGLVSAVTIADDSISVTGQSSGSIAVLQQVVTLQPGLYEFSAQLTDFTYTSGEGVNLNIQSYSPDYFTRGAIDMVPGQTTFFTVGAQRSKGELKLRFSIAPPRPAAAEIISKNSQTFNLSTNKNIKININGAGATADIDCSVGAVNAAAVSAKEVAAAINAGMAASSYGSEYHNIARAANGKVILTHPYIGSDRTHSIVVADGGSVSALTTIFGGDGIGVPLLANHDSFSGIPVTIGVYSNFVGSFTMGGLSLRRIGEQ